ncbi:MAG: hypothetical protein PHT32_00935 [Candidatus Omnitrophica bacterium]|nr:hypothetical protein [Candidatus Omnitrophota bacterium]
MHTFIKTHIWNLISLAGFSITIWQLLKVKKVATVAKDAAIDAKKHIKSNVTLSDLTLCKKFAEEIKMSLRSKKYEAALLRTGDLLSYLNQLHPIMDDKEVRLKDSIAQLAILQESLEHKIRDEEYRVDVILANKKLSEIVDRVDTWIGKTKYE